jgi:hypothetical protein
MYRGNKPLVRHQFLIIPDAARKGTTPIQKAWI